MPEIREISEEAREWERTSAHSHVKGLGLKGLEAEPISDGMVGQESAREAAGLMVRLVREGKFAGHGALVAGPVGTGKTALAVGISRELGGNVPFVQMAASETYSTEMKKTEFLKQKLRKAIGVKIEEMRQIYEGKVVKLDIETQASSMNPYQKVPSSAKITLETTDQQKTLSVGRRFAIKLKKKGIKEGDVIQIDEDGNRIVRLGRAEEEVGDEKLIAGEVVPKPSGNAFKNKKFTYVVSLHQMDLANSQARRKGLLTAFFGGGREISSELRERVNKQAKEMVEKGKAEIIPGVLFIDECSMLDLESFAFLNRAMEKELSPILVFSTNRGITKIKGADISSPHGIPRDLLDRLLIINTESYDQEEIKHIIKIRAEEEDIELTDEALGYATKVGVESSLRYATRLLAPAWEKIKEEDKDKVEEEDIEYVKELFSDVDRSIKYLKESEERFLQ